MRTDTPSKFDAKKYKASIDFACASNHDPSFRREITQAMATGYKIAVSEHLTERSKAMTMPHLMNCGHDESGWCLDCVKELAAERDALLAACEIAECYEDDDRGVDEYRSLLRSHGWDGIERAGDFRRRLRRAAIAKAKGTP